MNTKDKKQKITVSNKILGAICLIFFLHLSPFSIFHCSAQRAQFYSIEYSTGSLLGSSRNLINQYSWRGGCLNGQIFLIDNLAIGFRFGFNNYYSNVDARTYDNGNGGRLYANTYRYIRKAPFQIGAVGHVLPNGIIKPFLGLYLGLCYATESIMIQDIQSRKENFGFILTPELGVFVQFGKKTPAGMKLSVAYNLATNKYKLGMTEFDNLQSVNINIGLSYFVKRR